MDYCEHLSETRDVKPSAEGCENCLKTGGRWIHLRLCEICGQVGCCDDSPNRPATKHFKDVGNPIIKSFEPGEEWVIVSLMTYFSILFLKPNPFKILKTSAGDYYNL